MVTLFRAVKAMRDTHANNHDVSVDILDCLCKSVQDHSLISGGADVAETQKTIIHTPLALFRERLFGNAFRSVVLYNLAALALRHSGSGEWQWHTLTTFPRYFPATVKTTPLLVYLAVYSNPVYGQVEYFHLLVEDIKNLKCILDSDCPSLRFITSRWSSRGWTNPKRLCRSKPSLLRLSKSDTWNQKRYTVLLYSAGSYRDGSGW